MVRRTIMSWGDYHRMDADTEEQALQRIRQVDAELASMFNLSLSDPSPDFLTNEANLPPFSPEMVQALYTEDVEIQMQATRQLRKLLCDSPSPPVEQIIASGAVPRFVAFLADIRYPELQLESGWVLINIAAAQTRVVIDAGALPVLISLLASPNEDIVEQSVWTLRIIARDSPQSRQFLLLNNVVQILHGLLNDGTRRSSMMRIATTELLNLCQH